MNIIKFLQDLALNTAGKQPTAKHLAHISLYELKGIDALQPGLKEIYIKLEKRMKKLGKPIYISEGFRTAKRQDDYYSRGRTTGGKIITNAKGLQSYHNYGLAFDVIFKDYAWSPPSSRWWASLGREGKKLGLEWGGDWTFKDYPHFEYHPTFTWHTLMDYLKR